jgi:hypothetical protein
MSERCKVVMRAGRLSSWPFVFVAMTIAADGWLMLGPLAQSTLMAAALLRRLRGKRARPGLLGSQFAEDSGFQFRDGGMDVHGVL